MNLCEGAFWSLVNRTKKKQIAKAACSIVCYDAGLKKVCGVSNVHMWFHQLNQNVSHGERVTNGSRVTGEKKGLGVMRNLFLHQNTSVPE